MENNPIYTIPNRGSSAAAAMSHNSIVVSKFEGQAVFTNLPQEVLPLLTVQIPPPPSPSESTIKAAEPLVEDDKQDGEDQGKRKNVWGKDIEFVLSCVSMSVGFGNIWRFPFVAYKNGGGAFLIPYMVALLILGRPMYFLEMCLGQFTSLGPVKTMGEICPIFRGVGYASAVGAFCCLSFFGGIMAVVVNYFVLSFENPLPWSKEAYCSSNNCTNENASLSYSELYYFGTAFPQYDSIDEGLGLPHWKLVIGLFFSWSVVYFCQSQGVKSSGKVAYFTAFFPYTVLIALLIQGLLLPGAVDGILYFVTPKWEKLLDLQVWFAAVSQCFFSLGIGFGTITHLSSYNRFTSQLYRDALIISLTDTFTSCLAGCCTFSILGYLAKAKNVSIEDVTRGGPGLAFVAFPEGLAQLKWLPQLFAILFFLMMFTLGSGSAMCFTGQLAAIIIDEYPKSKEWFVALLICGVGFLSSIVFVTPGGQFILTLVTHNGVDIIIYTTAILEIIAVAWVYGVNRFARDIKFMLNKDLPFFYKLCWNVIMPIVLFVLLVYFYATYRSLEHDGLKLPISALVCGWIITVATLLTLPIFAIKAVLQSEGDTWCQKIKNSFNPLPSWGPKSPAERSAWLTEMKDILGADNEDSNQSGDKRSLTMTTVSRTTTTITGTTETTTTSDTTSASDTITTSDSWRH